MNTLDGKPKKAVGKAKVPDKNQPGWLKVSFFLWFYGDYFVYALDPDYKWALIGSSTPNYLWILSRTPHIDKELYNNLTERAKSRGYDISKLMQVPQR